MKKATFGAIAAAARGSYPAIYNTWVSRVNTAGGTYTANSKAYALALANQLVAASYFSKIVWLLPLLGNNLAAARVPLVDTLGVGQAGNTNFVDGDFSETTGLQGNGTSKVLNTLIKPSQLGTSNNAGIGYWENNISFSGNSEIIGCYDAAGGTDNRYLIDLRNTVRFYSWGLVANEVVQLTAAVNAHYYGQRASSTSREFFVNGSSVGTNSTSDTGSGASDNNIAVLGSFGAFVGFWAGRCAVAYLTNGTFSSGDASAFHTLLGTYLITPTGR